MRARDTRIRKNPEYFRSAWVAVCLDPKHIEKPLGIHPKGEGPESSLGKTIGKPLFKWLSFDEN